MKIAVDARCLNRTNLRGIGNVLLNLMNHFPEPNVKWTLYGDRKDLPLHTPNIANYSVYTMSEWSWRLKTWEQIQLPIQLIHSKPDVAFYPANSLPFFQPTRSVTLLHDIIQWKEPDPKHSENWYRNYLLAAALKKTSAIVTISSHSAADIISQWPNLKQKLNVIPNGLNCSFSSQVKSLNNASASESPYFVYFGGSIARKRLSWAIDVFNKAELPNHDLLICGVDPKDASRIRHEVNLSSKHRIKFLNFVDEKSLPTLVGGATAILYPTLYEGFGLPVIEAAACGTACIFSDVSSLSELKGPNRIIVPPFDKQAWIVAIQDIAVRGGLSTNEALESQQWAAKFNWLESSKAYFQVFESVAL